MLRVPSQLSQELEDLICRTIGCCITVHRTLGPGLLEGIYTRALHLELADAGIPFEREKAYPVMYRDHLLCHQRLDFVVAGQLALEIKAIAVMSEFCRAQLLSYLRVSKLPAGLLINFNVAILKDGIKRMVL
jgi:GxxExxY protein